MKLMVVGAGPVTRDLLRSLGDVWQITVVDPDPERLARAGEVRPIEAVASTRVEDEALDALVAATADDDVNLDLCRRAREAGVAIVAAIAADPERLSGYRELAVPAFSPDRLAARRVETNLEPRRVASAEFAQGQAEAMEFRIARDSPLRGKALRDLEFTDWLVVAVLRGDRLIVPHGDSVLERDDLVTVVGDAAHSADMVTAFTEGRVRFPSDHGSRVATVVDETERGRVRVAEAAYLARHSAADGVALLHAAATDVARLYEEARADLPEDALLLRPVADADEPVAAAVAAEIDAAVVVVDPPAATRVAGRRQSVRLVSHAQELARPVLVARGAHPYRRVVVQAGGSPAAVAASGAAIDLAAVQATPLLVVAVITPPFIAGPNTTAEVRAAAARIREEASLRGVTSELETIEGNPVRVMAAAAADHSLLVVGLPAGSPTLVAPGVVSHLVQRSAASVLLVPGRD